MEKLIVEPDKVIHILLKHLMDLKNEIVYVKNKAAIHSMGGGRAEKMEEVNKVGYGTVEHIIGVNNVGDAIVEKNIGVNKSGDAIREKVIGVNSLGDGIMKKNIGVNNDGDVIGEKSIGVNNTGDAIGKNNIGVITVFDTLLKAIDGVNGGAMLHSVFESELLKALDDYIKNGDGQTNLFKFYIDFLAAVEERNEVSLRIEDAKDNLSLEDTHLMPLQIIVDNNSIYKIVYALLNTLPTTAQKSMHKKIAVELMLLHNKGKATSAEMRQIKGTSVNGYGKHLSKLLRYGLIRKHPPLNYVLTEKSKRILLEQFGVAKI